MSVWFWNKKEIKTKKKNSESGARIPYSIKQGVCRNRNRKKKAKTMEKCYSTRGHHIQCPTNYLLHEICILSCFWNSLMDEPNFKLFSTKTCSYFLFIFSPKVPKISHQKTWFHTHEFLQRKSHPIPVMIHYTTNLFVIQWMSTSMQKITWKNKLKSND